MAELLSPTAAPSPTSSPSIGFYLQPAVGGRLLPLRVLAAVRRDPERRRDQDRAVQPLPDARRGARRGRGGPRTTSRSTPATTTTSSCDLLTPYRFGRPASRRRRIVGGLLGHWAVWTQHGRRACSRSCQPRGAARRPRAGSSAAAEHRGDRLQRRVLRRRQRLRRLHRRAARGAAAPGTAARHLVPRPARDARPGPAARSTASTPPIRT